VSEPATDALGTPELALDASGNPTASQLDTPVYRAPNRSLAGRRR